MEGIIRLDDISKVYRTKEIETTALEHISIEVPRGEFISIMGPSGCGKSTLLNIIGLLDSPTAGTVNILGSNVGKLGDSKKAHFRNSNIGFVFQSFHLIPSLNVADNVALPLLYNGSHMSAHQRRERIESVLARLGMSHRLKHLPSQLSGGQCQRVAIARAIVNSPAILLADEPTGNLDSKMGAEVMELLHRLNKEDGTTIVMVTHNEEQALKTDRIIHFFDGHIVL